MMNYEEALRKAQEKRRFLKMRLTQERKRLQKDEIITSFKKRIEKCDELIEKIKEKLYYIG